MSPRPRLLLVEDDLTIQHLVTLALEELELELRICGGMAEALELLERAPVQLLITDLMLPDGSGLALLRKLAAEPRLRGGAPLVVFSAGLRAEVRDQLSQLGVWRMLSKPCSVLELEACVREGLSLGAAPPAPAGESSMPAGALPPEQAEALARHFGGDLALYQAFRQGCLEQFLADVALGDQLSGSRDAAGLRRLAHSLKSVLLTLGHPTESLLARQLEDGAEKADWEQSLPLWQALRTRLPRTR